MHLHVEGKIVIPECVCVCFVGQRSQTGVLCWAVFFNQFLSQMSKAPFESIFCDWICN